MASCDVIKYLVPYKLYLYRNHLTLCHFISSFFISFSPSSLIALLFYCFCLICALHIILVSAIYSFLKPVHVSFSSMKCEENRSHSHMCRKYWRGKKIIHIGRLHVINETKRFVYLYFCLNWSVYVMRFWFSSFLLRFDIWVFIFLYSWQNCCNTHKMQHHVGMFHF